MISALIVLCAVLLSIAGIAVGFVLRRGNASDKEVAIESMADIDRALAIQRSERISELRRRMNERSAWPYVLFGFAFWFLMAALAVDHSLHPAVAFLMLFPGIFITVAARAARRRVAQRELEAIDRIDPSPTS